MKPGRALKRLHGAAGAVLGFVFFIWLASGLALALLPEAAVDGAARAQTIISPELDARSYASPGGAIAQTPGASAVTLKYFLGRVVYLVEGPTGPALFDARTGDKLSPLPEQMARDVAQRDYVGDGKLVSLRLLRDRPGEYRGESPIWRAEFDDSRETRLYISPASGEVKARRNRYSTLHDFLRAVHLFDVENSGRSGAGLFIAGGAGVAYLLLSLGLLIASRVGALSARTKSPKTKKPAEAGFS